MKSLFLSISVFFAIHSYSQTSWTKTDRESLYSEYLNMLSKYKTVALEQKESIALCALEATTAKYNKSDFATKIDIELKRIYESQLSQCSKNIGVDLQLSSPVIETPKETLINTEWTKEEKLKLSKEFNTFLADYPNITETQKDELSLCYVQKTVAEFTPEAFAKLIDLEIKQQRINALKFCVEGTTIDLTKTLVKQSEIVDNKVYKKKDVIGSWISDVGITFTFNENNFATLHYKDGERVEYYGSYMFIKDDKGEGSYFVDENGLLTFNQKIIFYEYKMFGRIVEYEDEVIQKFKVIFCDGDFMKLSLIEIDGKPNPDNDVFQLNKIKN